MTVELQYIDDYPSCARTYATLCIYPADRDVMQVTKTLEILPTRTTMPTADRPAVKAGWFLTSDGAVASRDLRRHLDWLISMVSGRAQLLREIQSDASKTNVSCYWRSVHGSGGPIISVSQMTALTALGLDVEFDLYCGLAT